MSSINLLEKIDETFYIWEDKLAPCLCSSLFPVGAEGEDAYVQLFPTGKMLLSCLMKDIPQVQQVHPLQPLLRVRSCSLAFVESAHGVCVMETLGDEWFKSTGFGICLVLASWVEVLPYELAKSLSLSFQRGMRMRDGAALNETSKPLGHY